MTRIQNSVLAIMYLDILLEFSFSVDNSTNSETQLKVRNYNYITHIYIAPSLPDTFHNHTTHSSVGGG